MEVHTKWWKEWERSRSVLSRTITHAALPSCRVFLGVEHEIFNQTKVETFVQSVGLILVSDWASVSSSWVERREITTGTYRRREHRTCRAQRPPRWRAWRWRTCPGSPCWKGKICYSQIQQLTWDSNWENGCWKKEGKSGFRFVGCGLGRSQFVCSTTQWSSVVLEGGVKVIWRKWNLNLTKDFLNKKIIISFLFVLQVWLACHRIRSLESFRLSDSINHRIRGKKKSPAESSARVSATVWHGSITINVIIVPFIHHGRSGMNEISNTVFHNSSRRPWAVRGLQHCPEKMIYIITFRPVNHRLDWLRME